MGQVINFNQYRRRSRKAYLAKYGGRIDRLIERFVRLHVDVDFRQLALDYQSGAINVSHGASWDYVHFREVLIEAFDEAFGKPLYEMLTREFWFDLRIVSREEIIERCLRTYILERCDYAIIS